MKELATALAKAQAAIKPALKDSVNPHFKSKYADLSAIWESCREPLSKNGLSIVQTMDFDAGEVWLKTTLLHSSGESIDGRYPLRPIKQDPQGFGSALTYARRYCLAALVGIVADEDDDGNAASQRNGNGHAAPTTREPERRTEPVEKPPSAVAAFLKGKSLSIVVPGAKAGKPDYTAWGNSLWKAVGACEDVRTLERLWADNSDQLIACKKVDQALHDEVEKSADLRRYDLSQPQTTTLAAE